MSAVRLVPMRPEAFDSYRERLIREYAAEKVAAGNWPDEGSVERSRADINGLLTDGLATPGHHLWTIDDEAGGPVGQLWVGPQVGRANAIYIYDIEIDADRRGQGFGGAALAALETWARDAGFERIGLQVFAINDVARRLYERSGFVETNIVMEKRLDGSG